MDEAVQQFVERMALVCEKEGMPRIAGRIFGYLLATGQTFPLEDLADRLQASKASVSTNARMLEQLGFIRRVGVMGDRRDFYRAQDEPWERMLRGAQARWREMVEVFDEAARTLPDEGARARVAEASRFHALMIRECDRVIDAWHALPAGERADGGPGGASQAAA